MRAVGFEFITFIQEFVCHVNSNCDTHKNVFLSPDQYGVYLSLYC
jgi:hypothetical protein